MANSGVGTGIGIGIGHALDAIGQGWAQHSQQQNADREKQADALHAKGLQIAQNLQQYALDAPDPTAIQFSGKSYKPEAAPLIDQLKQTSEQVRGLFGPHETPALVQHFRKFLGKQPKPPTPNPRAAQYSPEGFAAEVPQAPFKWSGKSGDFIQLSKLAADPSQSPDARAAAKAELDALTVPATDQWDKIGEPKEGADGKMYETFQKKGTTETKSVPVEGMPAPAKKPPTAKKVGASFVITDPNSGKEYGPGNIESPDTPPEVKSMYAGFVKDEADKAAAAEQKELSKIEEQNKRDDKRFANQIALQTKSFQNAFAQKDYSEAQAIKKTADARYSNAVALSAFADDALKTPVAAKDKMLAGRLIKESEGRFNPAQYDNLVKNAGLANTFEQWMNNAETGELTPKIRQQLVDTAHSLLSSADTARKALVEPDTPGNLKDKAKPKASDPDQDFIDSLSKPKKP